MNLENQKAVFGLSARSEMTAPGAPSGELQLIGVPSTEVNFADADIIYSFKVTSNAANDVALIDIETGVFTADTGSPTSEDADGKDFEGTTLPAMVNCLGIAAYVPSANTGYVYAEVGIEYVEKFYGSSGDSAVKAWPAGRAIVNNTFEELALSFSAGGDSIFVTIIGKSS